MGKTNVAEHIAVLNALKKGDLPKRERDPEKQREVPHHSTAVFLNNLRYQGIENPGDDLIAALRRHDLELSPGEDRKWRLSIIKGARFGQDGVFAGWSVGAEAGPSSWSAGQVESEEVLLFAGRNVDEMMRTDPLVRAVMADPVVDLVPVVPGVSVSFSAAPVNPVASVAEHVTVLNAREKGDLPKRTNDPEKQREAPHHSTAVFLKNLRNQGIENPGDDLIAALRRHDLELSQGQDGRWRLPLIGRRGMKDVDSLCVEELNRREIGDLFGDRKNPRVVDGVASGRRLTRFLSNMRNRGRLAPPSQDLVKAAGRHGLKFFQGEDGRWWLPRKDHGGGAGVGSSLRSAGWVESEEALPFADEEFAGRDLDEMMRTDPLVRAVMDDPVVDLVSGVPGVSGSWSAAPVNPAGFYMAGGFPGSGVDVLSQGMDGVAGAGFGYPAAGDVVNPVVGFSGVAYTRVSDPVDGSMGYGQGQGVWGDGSGFPGVGTVRGGVYQPPAERSAGHSR
ncbi:hypothetical protein ACWD5R_05700 [Streptomyces sp. NPDC002514]|uniref:hypothetical protein n=1 Tax=Streptomyces sp. NPDC001270 TaxID=3364554 RepID=UPI00369936EA